MSPGPTAARTRLRKWKGGSRRYAAAKTAAEPHGNDLLPRGGGGRHRLAVSPGEDPAFAVAQRANLARGRAQRWAAPLSASPPTSAAVVLPKSSSPQAVGAGVDKSTVIATAVVLALIVIVIIAIAHANRDANLYGS